MGVVIPRRVRRLLSAQRLLAAVTALAFVVAGLAGRSHEAAVSHVRCEHGELTHAVESGARDRAPGSSASVLVERSGAIVHGHEHCELAYAHPAIAPLGVYAPKPVTVAVATAPRVIASVVAPRAAIYRTAPKTSPPA